VGAVAEGFVFGGAAAAEGDAIADLVLESLGGDDGNAATQPDGAGALLRGIFYQPNGDGEFGLDGLAGLFVDGDETAGGAVAGLLDEALACGVVVGVLDLAPDLAVGIAEAREGAEAFDVGELHGGAVEDLGLRGEGFARGGEAQGQGSETRVRSARRLSLRGFCVERNGTREFFCIFGGYFCGVFSGVARSLGPGGLTGPLRRSMGESKEVGGDERELRHALGCKILSTNL